MQKAKVASLRSAIAACFSKKATHSGRPQIGPTSAFCILHYAFRAWLTGGWHTALGAAGLAADAGVRTGAPMREVAAFAALAGGGTLALYGGRYALSALRGSAGEREEALRAAPAFMLFSWLVGATLAGAGALALPWTFAAWSAVWGLAGLAYCFPLIGRPWREYGPAKPFLLALCWSAITCGPPIHGGWAALAAVRFVWLAGLCLAFDLKDVSKDRIQGVRTPAVAWRERRLWFTVGSCLVAGLVGKLLLVPPRLRWPVAVAWIVSLLMLAQIRRSRSTRDWVLWGDGMMIAYALIPMLVMLFG